MNLDPASINSPFFSHPFATIGNFDACRVYGYHNWLSAGYYRIWQAQLQLSPSSSDIGIVSGFNLRNEPGQLPHKAF